MLFQIRGKHRSMSYFRRLVTDLMYFAKSVPSVTIERRMNLAELMAARKVCRPAPSWSSIFVKALAIVAARTPALRTSYMKFPWPHFFESANNVVTLNIDRQLATERIVLWAHIKNPEKSTLNELDAIVRSYQNDPVKTLLPYRRAVRMSRFPWPIRQWMWWLSLNVMGSVRCHNYGTIGISSLGALGTNLESMVSLLTAQLHYGLFDKNGELPMRLTFDHRVLDGAAGSQVLADLEDVLMNEMLQECAGRNDEYDGQLRLWAA